ncbi:hypothetical protein BABINDRAFT_158848 [Babjeviella inositovora NRRL Y-12698]|uniref:Uncharacterized protein n=1 Tax=Babjeviella inositovora NRRL Y-12698 TaxID=984486 RepID=A0A1E3QX00_9ASCO|nr:uncharacterized protein BABINDRAFT_158848 [Babjeviella inositovora NRRL Y-12698]ODQ82203.1 hypothetical protein BABINDRAFT_158848 [Babjeviella inositovora NRRL Y-12698]
MSLLVDTAFATAARATPSTLTRVYVTQRSTTSVSSPSTTSVSTVSFMQGLRRVGGSSLTVDLIAGTTTTTAAPNLILYDSTYSSGAAAVTNYVITETDENNGVQNVTSTATASVSAVVPTALTTSATNAAPRMDNPYLGNKKMVMATALMALTAVFGTL